MRTPEMTIHCGVVELPPCRHSARLSRSLDVHQTQAEVPSRHDDEGRFCHGCSGLRLCLRGPES